MIKIGVLGAGHLGKIHIKLLKEIEGFELSGFYDSNEEEVKKVSAEFGIHAFENPETLIEAVEAIDIVTPTIVHFDCAVKALKNSRHIFIEKPITYTVEEAENLMKFAKEADVKVQVGHVERFNPAFLACRPFIDKPMFIESHRLSPFPGRGTDVPVVLDLMIHDIDIALCMVKSNVRKISASGVSIISNLTDIANARIEFDNGCVANLTASRISLKSMRKTRIFQRDAYISMDFLDKKAEVLRIRNTEKDKARPLSITIETGSEKECKEIYFEEIQIVPNNAIKEELLSFYQSIRNNAQSPVSLEDGYNAVAVAHQIIDKINQTSCKI